MKTPVKMLLVALIVVPSALFFKAPLMQGIYSFVTKDMFVTADEDNFDPGPKVGTKMPAISGIYNDEEIDSIEQFAGSIGTIFIANRSFEWCPYCMQQLNQLQQNKSLFDQAGIGLVVMTYDEPELQTMFAQKHGIDIPILSDINARSFESLNILNTEYKKGDEH